MTTCRPLTGLRVLDAVAGPMAAVGRLLGELGADVIRLEPPGGAADRRAGFTIAEMSLRFVAGNLGKRNAVFGPETFDLLAADADIVLENGALDIDGEALADRRPGLVVVSISDFGRTGRFATWQGSGAVFHALSGELSRSGFPGGAPLLPPEDLAYECAAAQATFVTLLSYFNRLRTGRGDWLDFSVLDGAAQALDPGYGIAGSAAAGIPHSMLPRGRTEARHLYPIIPCKDGFVRICVLAPRQWQGMFEWMGRPEEFADPSFKQMPVRFASKTLLPAIAGFFADKTWQELEEAGERHGVPTARLCSLGEATRSEQMAARNAFVPVTVAPGIEVPLPNGMIEIDGCRMGIAGSGPVSATDGNAQWAPRPADWPTAPAGGDLPAALAGLRVLDMGVIVVGAEQGRLLADQGADVVKVENADFPDGSRQNVTNGPISMSFASGHRNKRALGLDLRRPEGRELMLRLLKDTDVLLSNFKAGTLESLGLDPATLKAVNPALIVVDSSAFGPTGPWSRRMGYGPLVRAAAGLTHEWRYPELENGFSDGITVYPDHVAARIGIIGVLALLIRRARTGAGGAVSVSQAEVMMGHLVQPIARAALAERGHSLQGQEPQSGVYPTLGDDDWCVVTQRDQRDRAAVQRVTGGRPLADWLSEQTARAAMETLQAAGVPAAMMLRVSEMPDFDYFRERGFFQLVRHPLIADPLWQEASPVPSRHLPPPPGRPAPLMGEHTHDVLRAWLGLTFDEIDALLAARIVQAGPQSASERTKQ